MNSFNNIFNKKYAIAIFFVLLKMFCFYTLIVAFSFKTYSIEYINSISEFFEIVFLSRYTIKVAALCAVSGMFSFITLLPTAVLIFRVEKYLKCEIQSEMIMYIAIIASCFAISYGYGFISHVELYLCYLTFIPFEKLQIRKFINSNKSVIAIWSVAVLLLAFILLTFKYLDNQSGYINKEAIQGKNVVYICTGSSRIYHKTKKCKALKRCSKQVKPVIIEQAKRMGRRECMMSVSYTHLTLPTIA